MEFLKFIITFSCLTSVLEVRTFSEVNSTIGLEEDDSSKILSRRKRFIVFPDGSSFQLVFCTQNHGYLQLGNIVWFGNTAALAWELPSDPALFSMFKDKGHLTDNRRSDVTKNIYYLDDTGKVIGKVPYKRRPIVNPAFAKRSIGSDTPKEIEAKKSKIIQQMHREQKEKNIFHNLDSGAVNFHRESRKSLYEKVENLLKGLGWHGEDCLRRILCSIGQKEVQGSFMEEILTATFTFPRNAESHKYDVTPGSKEHCAQIYTDCSSGPQF